MKGKYMKLDRMKNTPTKLVKKKKNTSCELTFKVIFLSRVK